MAKIDDIDLMRYADGETTADESAQIARRLEQDTDARLKVEAVQQVSDTLRTYLEVSTDEVEHGFDSLWEQIEQGIGSNGHDRQVAEPVPVRRKTHQAGFFATIRHWFRESSGQFSAGALVAGAVAALFVMMNAPEESPTAQNDLNAQRHVLAAVPMPVVSLPSPATVEELNVENGAGHILTIPGEDGDTSTTVIWLDLDQASLEDPI